MITHDTDHSDAGAEGAAPSGSPSGSPSGADQIAPLLHQWAALTWLRERTTAIVDLSADGVVWEAASGAGRTRRVADFAAFGLTSADAAKAVRAFWLTQLHEAAESIRAYLVRRFHLTPAHFNQAYALYAAAAAESEAGGMKEI